MVEPKYRYASNIIYNNSLFMNRLKGVRHKKARAQWRRVGVELRSL